MSNLGTRYASALLSIALDENKNYEYREYIKGILKVLEDDKGLITLLESNNLDKDEKKNVIDKVFASCPYASIKDCLKVIIDNNRAHYLEDVLKDFVTLSNAKDNISEGYIYSASKLSDMQIEEITIAISKKLNKKVYLIPKIDEELIGGFKVMINDYVFDTSIKNKVEKLRVDLMERR